MEAGASDCPIKENIETVEKLIAKSSFSIPKENGIDSSFTEGKSYRFVIRSNGDYVVMDNEGSAVQLEEEHAESLFKNLLCDRHKCREQNVTLMEVQDGV